MPLRNFSWVIPDKLAGSDIPGGAGVDGDSLLGDLQYLAATGIRMLVSLERPSGPVAKLCGHAGIVWRNFPVPDFGIPHDRAKFADLVKECIDSFSGGMPVCVHCRAGIGRTGMALACIVGAHLGIGAEKAIAAVKQARPAVETEEQRMFITSFLEHYES